MDKITNIKHKLIQNKSAIFIQNLSHETLDKIAKILSCQKSIVVYEENTVSDNDFLTNCSKLRQLCSIFDSLFFISKRLDIAKLSNADGVMLSKNDVPLNFAKKILDENVIFSYLLQASVECQKQLENNWDMVFIDKDKKMPLNAILSSQNNTIPCISMERI